MFAAIRGYHRRRGWLAWHIGMLGRVREFPKLHVLTGEPEPLLPAEEEAERRLQILRQWKAARAARRKGD